jgi:multimeric flavodoxin WrbA
MGKKILGIVGSYRKGGVIDSLVTEVLSAAEQQGAQIKKIYLVDQHVEFCTNCRKCTQNPGAEPGKCIHRDDMESILARVRDSDAIVLGAPVNFFNINAVTRKFMERLACFSYWPWGAKGPQMRTESKDKKAVLITSMAMPALLGRFFTGALRALKIAATTMGAKPVASIVVGMAAQKEHPSIPIDAVSKAREAGRNLATD